MDPMSDYAIRNCIIAYKCNQQCEKLDETESPRIRHCRECDREVVACETVKQLKNALNMNSCVAISVEFLDIRGGMVGVVIPKDN
jgi:hypothetical protein